MSPVMLRACAEPAETSHLFGETELWGFFASKPDGQRLRSERQTDNLVVFFGTNSGSYGRSPSPEHSIILNLR